MGSTTLSSGNEALNVSLLSIPTAARDRKWQTMMCDSNGPKILTATVSRTSKNYPEHG